MLGDRRVLRRPLLADKEDKKQEGARSVALLKPSPPHLTGRLTCILSLGLRVILRQDEIVSRTKLL